MISIRRSRFAELESAANFAEQTAEYAAESAIEGLPPPAAHFQTYRMMEAAGAMHVLGAYRGADLIGFIILLVSMNPHYGLPLAVTESFFVAHIDRKSGAGLKLLRAAEDLAAKLGAQGLLVSAPAGGRLADVMPGAGYRETNRVFFRSLP